MNESIDVRRARRLRFGYVDPDVVLRPDLTVQAKALYAVLATYADDKRSAFPSRATLASQLGEGSASERTVTRAIRELEDKGVLEVHRRREEQRASVYVLLDFQRAHDESDTGTLVTQEYPPRDESDTGLLPFLTGTSDTDGTKNRTTNNTSSNRTKNRTRARGTRISPDWEPSTELATWVRDVAPMLNLTATVETFVDYWLAKPGQGGVKLDWNATFRNWVRRDAERMRPRGGGHTPVSDWDNGAEFWPEDVRGRA